VSLEAAAQKKHILVDKPFSSSANVRRIAEACESNQVVFLDGTHFVHSPRLQEMQRQIKQGTIGKLLKVSVACTTFLPSKEDIRYNPSLEPTGCLGDIGKCI
jgi:predicted dehydrogenase